MLRQFLKADPDGARAWRLEIPSDWSLRALSVGRWGAAGAESERCRPRAVGIQRQRDGIVGPSMDGWPSRLIASGDERFIVTTATTRFEALGQPFTRWSLRKLPAHIADNEAATVKIGRERPSPDSSR